jgi:hypothetical protein
MRRFFLACALIGLCALPFGLNSVDASAGTEDIPSKVRTVVRGVVAGGLTTDEAGRVYFTANNRVYRVPSDLRISGDPRTVGAEALELVAGNGERGSLGDGGPAILAQLDLLIGANSAGAAANGNLASDISGNLFLADILNDSVRRVDAESQLISTVAGRWTTETAEAITSRDILQPSLVAVDDEGSVYLAGNNRLSRLTPAGAFSQIATVVNPVALAVTRDGKSIAVASQDGKMLVVLERSDPAHYLAAFSWPATYETKFGNTADATGSADSDETRPGLKPPNSFSGLTFDAIGKIYMAEKNANVIDRLDIKSRTHERVAGDGRAGYSGDGGAALLAEFNSIGALAIDREGNLFVSDTGNLAIREIAHVAVAAGVTLTPNTFTFPDEPIGGSSVAEVFTLTNNSSSQVTGISIDFSGGATPPDFTQTSTCATTLNVSSSCTTSVVFSPQAAGNRSAALQVTDSDPSSPQTAALAGFADDYELGLQSGNTDTLTVVQGTTANYNLAVVPDNTFSGTVTIQCPVGLPLDVSCELAAGTASSSSGGASGSSGPTTLALTVSPGMPQNFTLALTTMAKNQAVAVPPAIQRRQFPTTGLAILLVSAMAAIFVAWRTRHLASRLRAGLEPQKYLRVGTARSMLAIALLTYAVVGCGSGGTPTLNTKPNPGTPAGTYHFNVIGASQGASRAFTITLIVQSP